MLPEPLRKQLSHLLESGCPAALVERAMGMKLVGEGWDTARHEDGKLVLECELAVVAIAEDGTCDINCYSINYDPVRITIPPPKVDA